MTQTQPITNNNKKTKLIKLFLKVIFGVTAIAFLVYAFLPEPAKVDMQNVVEGDLIVTIEGEGKTRIHDIYVVSAPIEGRVTRIESEPGDRVAAGKTVLANMYPANPRFLDKRSETQARADVEGARAALALANARVKQALAQLEFDEADFQRTQELFQKNTVSKANLERAELRLKTLRAELETAQSNQKVMESRLQAARARLLQPEGSNGDVNQSGDAQSHSNCQICIYSPVDGQLLKVLHKSESVVPVGTPLVEVGDTKDLEVIIELLSTNAVKVNVGDQALIRRWGGEQEIKAEVKLIEPAGFTKISALGVEEQRVNVVLRFIDAIEKWKALGHAFRVEAAIIVDRADQVPLIPLSALFRQNEVWSVFKVEQGIAKLQQVEVGKRNDRFVEIKSGLKVSEQIIVHPGSQVEDGVKVAVR